MKNEINTDASAAGAAAGAAAADAASAAAFVFTTVFTVVATVAAAEAAAVAAAVAAAPAAASVSEEKNSWTLNIIRFLVFVTLFLHGGVRFYLRASAFRKKLQRLQFNLTQTSIKKSM